MIYDIENICRRVTGFSKKPNKYGYNALKVEYPLKPIHIDFLRNLFGINKDDPDLVVADMIVPLEINEKQAEALQPYVINGVIDLNKYLFYLEYVDASV